MQVKLPPLEFTDCLTDSPFFRDNLHKHEKQIDHTSLQIKRLIKEVKDLLFATKQLSQAQRTFAKSLNEFTFECIGGSQTDDETVITKSLKEFARLITVIEDERDRMLSRAYENIIVPLKNFRKIHIGGVKEGRKKFNKQSTKFCQIQERYLNLSTKKQDNILQEADASLDMADRHFFQASMEYVFLLQEVQERKKFEFVETILSFMIGWLTFYHQGHEIATDSRGFMQNLQYCIQKTRDNFNETRNQTESLKKKMLEARQQVMDKPSRSTKESTTKEGYLFLMEKKAFGTTWTKQYCKYDKRINEFTIVPFNQINVKTITTNSEKMILETCTRRMSDTIDKRFCFDVSFKDRPGLLYTFQALNDDDRKSWLDIMDGKEPTYSSPITQQQKTNEFILDEIGINFIQKCIDILEKRGLCEQGLYRVVGVSSKVNRMLTMGLDRRKSYDLSEWESKTITSALKTYLRNLPEPIMTYKNYNGFILAAKNETKQNRVNDVHYLIHKLPKPNFETLNLLIKHLVKVAEKSGENLMTIGNLSVCFGPTLLRPEEETVASIMDLKFYSVVIDILIENCEKIFTSKPESTIPFFSIKSDIIEQGSSQKQRIIKSAPAFQNYNQNIQKQFTLIPKQTLQLQVPSPQPITHAITKTYYDGPNQINISSSLYNVSALADKDCCNGSSNFATNNQIISPIRPIQNTSISAQSESNLHTLQNFTITDSVKEKTMFFNTISNLKPNISTSPSSSNDSISSISSFKDITNISSNQSPMLTKKLSPLSVHYVTGYKSPKNNVRVRTLFACMGENDGELSFEPNQIITNVKVSQEPGWLEGTLNGKTGLIPENYVEMLP